MNLQQQLSKICLFWRQDKKAKISPMLKKYFLSWEILKTINTNRIVTSTYIWLVIVPFVAKLTSKLEETICIDFHGKVYEIDIVLPFSWQLVFLSALAFALGNITYILFCPPIIKKYQDASDFISTGKPQGALVKYMNKELKKEQYEHEKNLVAIYEMRKKKGIDEPDIGIATLKNDSVRQQFWLIYNYWLDKNTNYRRLATFFYVLGFIAFFIVALDNLFWVLPQIDIASILRQ